MDDCETPCIHGQGECFNGTCMCFSGYQHSTSFLVKLDCGSTSEHFSSISFSITNILCIVVFVIGFNLAIHKGKSLKTIMVYVGVALASFSQALGIGIQTTIEMYPGVGTTFFYWTSTSIMWSFVLPLSLVIYLSPFCIAMEKPLRDLERGIISNSLGMLLGTFTMYTAAAMAFHVIFFDFESAHLYDPYNISMFNALMSWSNAAFVWAMIYYIYALIATIWEFKNMMKHRIAQNIPGEHLLISHPEILLPIVKYHIMLVIICICRLAESIYLIAVFSIEFESKYSPAIDVGFWFSKFLRPITGSICLAFVWQMDIIEEKLEAEEAKRVTEDRIGDGQRIERNRKNSLHKNHRDIAIRLNVPKVI